MINNMIISSLVDYKQFVRNLLDNSVLYPNVLKSEKLLQLLNPLLIFCNKWNELQVMPYIYKLCSASNFILCQVSGSTLRAISVDRLISLLSGLRYRQVVTLPRFLAVIVFPYLVGIELD